MKIIEFLGIVGLMCCWCLPAFAQNCQPTDCVAKPCLKTNEAISQQAEVADAVMVQHIQKAAVSATSICDPKDCPPICRILCKKACGDAVSLQGRSRAVASLLVLQPLPLRPLMVNSWSLIKKGVTPLFSSS